MLPLQGSPGSWEMASLEAGMEYVWGCPAAQEVLKGGLNATTPCPSDGPKHVLRLGCRAGYTCTLGHQPWGSLCGQELYPEDGLDPHLSHCFTYGSKVSAADMWGFWGAPLDTLYAEGLTASAAPFAPRNTNTPTAFPSEARLGHAALLGGTLCPALGGLHP